MVNFYSYSKQSCVCILPDFEPIPSIYNNSNLGLSYPTMDSTRKPKGHKNFYIDLNYPPGGIFTEDDIVSGKCVLLSTRDEDIGSISISFHGTVKTQVVITNNSQSTQVRRANYNSEDVLFSESKLLYEGTYTLRKNVPYEWPFEFRLPSSLPASGTFNSGSGNGQVTYELEACRARTWQDPSMLAKQMNPRNDLKGAPFQPSKLFEKVGQFTGMIATAALQVTPARPALVDPHMSIFRSQRQFMTSSAQNQSPGSHHKISGLFHSNKDEKVMVGYMAVLELPQNLINGTAIPIFLTVVSDTPNLAPVSLHSVDIHLMVHTTVRSSPGNHHNNHETRIPISKQSKANLSITPNSQLDLGNSFNLQLDPTFTPNFDHGLLRISYGLKAEILLECGGNKFKEEFVAEQVTIMSNRVRNSPPNFADERVKIMSNRINNSPLRYDHFCTFTSEIQRSPFEHGTMVYPGSESEAEISIAYLQLSRLLTEKSIPHNPVPSPDGRPTIIFHGQPQFSDAPASYSSSSSSIPTSPPQYSGNSLVQNPLEHDQRLLGSIIDGNSNFEATSLPASQGQKVRHFAYLWHAPAPQSYSSDNYVRLEISGMSESYPITFTFHLIRFSWISFPRA